MRYPLAERFKAPQGEGLHTGTPMAFVRLVGCSVGQGVCTACDTDYDRQLPNLGGGLYTAEEIVAWAQPYRHLCITGGEPLDRDLRELVSVATSAGMDVHVETSGTKSPEWLTKGARGWMLRTDMSTGEPGAMQTYGTLWVTVSPKPGYLEEMIHRADELKVIVGGLGGGPGWPTVEQAVQWADFGALVYVQPRNSKLDIDQRTLGEAIAIVDRHPQLRLSCQLHKFWRTR